MHSTISSPRRRLGPILALLGALAVAITLIASSAGPAGARNVLCRSMTAGHRPGVVITAYDIGPIDMGCTSAERIVRAFIDRKISERSERCAGLAETPPYRGCIVDRFRCRATHRAERVNGRIETPQLCSDGRRLIYFAEHDTTSQ